MKNKELLKKAITETKAFLRMDRETKQIFNESKQVIKEMQEQIASAQFEIIWCKYVIEAEKEMQQEIVDNHIKMELEV